MSPFINMKDRDHPPRRMWALIGRPDEGKSTFSRQMRGPHLVIDPDGRYEEVLPVGDSEAYSMSETSADHHDPLTIKRTLDKNMPGAKVGTIILDSMTAILVPIVTQIMEEIERGEHQNRSAAWRPKASAVRLVQDALAKWGTDILIIYHEQDRLDAKGKEGVSATVSPREEARLLRSLNARVRLDHDAKGHYAEVYWSRTGRTGKVYDEASMWAGVPDKIDNLIWLNLTEAEKALAAGKAAPAVFADPQAAWAWGFAQGVFRDMAHAENAYNLLKTNASPKSAKQMRDLWVADVERREKELEENGVIEDDDLDVANGRPAIVPDEPDNSVLSDLLSLVGVEASPEAVAGWTDEQKAQAEEWAAAVHLKASDNDVDVPPRPDFLVATSTVSMFEESSAPEVFPSVAAAVAWGFDQGVFVDKETATAAYGALKTAKHPKTAPEMRDLWVKHVTDLALAQQVEPAEEPDPEGFVETTGEAIGEEIPF